MATYSMFLYVLYKIWYRRRTQHLIQQLVSFAISSHENYRLPYVGTLDFSPKFINLLLSEWVKLCIRELSMQNLAEFRIQSAQERPCVSYLPKQNYSMPSTAPAEPLSLSEEPFTHPYHQQRHPCHNFHLT